MSTAPGKQPAQAEPRVVKVRVLGGMPAVAAFLRVIADAAAAGQAGVLAESAPRPNHREPGHRVYLTLRLPRQDTDVCRAAHSHQAIRRPAAPSRRHLPS